MVTVIKGTRTTQSGGNPVHTQQQSGEAAKEPKKPAPKTKKDK